jgi:hypothetical protein
VLTGLLAPLASHAVHQSLERDPAAVWSVSVNEPPRLTSSVTRSRAGVVLLWDELGRRSAMAAMPALLGVVGW